MFFSKSTALRFTLLTSIAFFGLEETIQPKLRCVIETEKLTYTLGEVPEIKVTIRNLESYSVCLVRAIDGSWTAKRYPQCYFTVIGPDGKSSIKPIDRCGNLAVT